MENLKRLNRVCWVLGIVTGVVMVIIGLIGVWAEDWGFFQHLEKPFFTALIFFAAAAATIILNNAIMRFAVRGKDKRPADAPASAQSPESST